MKKLGFVLIPLIALGFGIPSLAFADAPRHCVDGSGHVMCGKPGCEKFCYNNHPGPNHGPGHHVAPPPPVPHHPVVPPPPVPHHPVVPPPPAPHHHVAPVPHKPMLPPPPPPAPHYNAAEIARLDRMIRDLQVENDHLAIRRNHSPNPHERHMLQRQIDDNNREISRLMDEQRRIRYYRR